MSDLIKKTKFLEAEEIDFFQFIRLIYRLRYRSQKPVKVCFLTSFSLGYPKNEIKNLSIIENETTYLVEVTTNFMNIVGTTSILPFYYTEYVINCNKKDDQTLADFINIFYDKGIALFIEILTKHSLTLESERCSADPTAKLESSYFYRINHLMGILPDNSEEPFPNFLLGYAGLLINVSRPAYILESILSNYYRLKVEVKQFIEEKIKLGNEELSKLGVQNCELGNSLYLGLNAHFNLNKIEICFYDLTYKLYERFLDDKKLIKELHKILEFYLEKQIGYILTFLVKESEKITFLAENKPRRLGQNIWCKC